MRRRLLLAALAAACSPGRPALAGGARRILAVGPGALRMVAYLDACADLVGIEDIERRPIAAASYRQALPAGLVALPSIGPGGPGRLPDLERLLALAPDLIVVATLDGQQLHALSQRAGVPVASADYGATGVLDEAVFYASLRQLGAALGRAGRADALVAYMRASLAELDERLAGRARVPAYLGGVSMQGSQGITSCQSGHRPLAWAHADNLADRAGRAGHVFLDREQLLAWDPGVLFVDGGGLAGILTEYAKDPAYYRRLRAVRAGQVYLTLPFNAYNTNVENALANAWFMAAVLHPEAMAGVDVMTRAAAIMRAFLGRDALPALARAGYGLGRLDLASGRWTAPS